jgi:tetratricopeptide (TPR) repeat protein
MLFKGSPFTGVMLMTGNSQRQIRRLVGSAIAIVVLCGANLFAQEEKISPLSDYMYKKDFAQYEAIKKETNVQKRGELLLAFVKERPISRILYYAVTDYQESVKPLIEKKDWAKVISMEEALLALLPSEKAVQAAQIPVGVEDFIKDQLRPSNLSVQRALSAAYIETKNLPKAAETAEKVYAMDPDKSMLPVLANIYLQIQNYDKYLVYAQKLLADTPIDQAQGYQTALTMAQVYIQKQQTGKAIELLGKVMSVYADKVPPGVQEASWNATRAFYYGAMAADAYGKKDYGKAQELYEKTVRFDPKRDDAYYFIGMCKWQNKDQENAIVSFARCVVLNKQYAPKAKQYLEELYKAQHNNSLDGLDQVLAKAKSDLGIG